MKNFLMYTEMEQTNDKQCVETMFGRLRFKRLDRGIRHMNKNDIKTIYKICKKVKSVKHG